MPPTGTGGDGGTEQESPVHAPTWEQEVIEAPVHTSSIPQGNMVTVGTGGNGGTCMLLHGNRR